MKEKKGLREMYIEENKRELLSKVEQLLSKPYIYIFILKKLVTKLLSNYTNYQDNYSLFSVLLSDLKKVISNLESFEFVFKDEFKSTIVLFCLKNEMVYANALKKIYRERDYRSVKFMLDYLVKNGILRIVTQDEAAADSRLRSKRDIFMRAIITNCPNAGFYHAKKTKFYVLTEEAKEFFSLFEDKLMSISRHIEDIEDFGKILSKTHEELKKLREEQTRIIRKCVEVLKSSLDSPNFPNYLETWCNKILPKYGIYLSINELLEMIKNEAYRIFKNYL